MICMGLGGAAIAQNTKGDRPQGNQRQVRETKSKSYKRKERGTTRDIANRRLRTKGKSSSNRANASYRQPSSTQRRGRSQPDVAARPRGRVFSESPRESRRRDWQGDVSGYRLNRVKPTGADAARNNVYPQKGPYVRYARKRPKEKPPVYGKTIKGTAFVRHEPRQQERAWKGKSDGSPVKVRSASAKHVNTFPQSGPYVRYYKKRVDKKPKAISNQREVARVRRLSRKPVTGGSQPSYYPESASRPYVQPGRKNVYWGKYQKKERGTTTDLTGAPVRTRNFRSAPAGLAGRDTLKYFGKKPLGDRGRKAPSGGYRSTRKGQKGWQGDVSGYPLRKSRSKGAGVQGSLKPTPPGIGGTWLSKTFNRKFKGIKPEKHKIPGGTGHWNNNGRSLQPRLGGPGGARAARFQGTMKSYGRGKTFGDQGLGYSGGIKSYGKGKTFGDQGTGYAGNIKRYGKGKTFSDQGAGYGGNIKRYGKGKTFSDQGAGYAGNIKQYGKGKTFTDQGIGFAGRTKRRRPAHLNEQGTRFRGDIKTYGRGKTFDDQGIGYAGNIKQRRGHGRQGYGYSGNLPSAEAAKVFGDQGLGYKGNIRTGTGTIFERQGAGYAGNIKRKRPAKGGGSISGKLWNNNGQSVSQNRAGIGTVRASQYQGDYKSWQLRPFFNDEYVGYQGNLKRRRPEKGGGSRSFQLWNNNNQALPPRLPRGDRASAINYSGHIKFRKPEKGGGSVSGQLWNNNNQALPPRLPRGEKASAINYTGHIKFKKPEKGGGSVSGQLWNNNNQALPPRLPRGDQAGAINYSGRQRLPRFKREYIQNENAHKESIKKHRPDETTFRVAGLQVKVKEKNYAKKPNAAKGSMPGISPTRSTVKASEYARGMKQYWDYKRNPNSDKEALKVREPSRANARIGDYQGNVKMHKWGGGRMHPDASYAHGYRDNVKEERTFFMNVKLTWAKLFRKSENQPQNLKDKPQRPRYDKREKGLWND